MNLPDLLSVLLVAALLWALWTFIRSGLFTRRAHGGAADGVIGELEGQRRSDQRVSVRVHRLTGESGKGTGVELVIRKPLDNSRLLATLTPEASAELAGVLRNAVARRRVRRS